MKKPGKKKYFENFLGCTHTKNRSAWCYGFCKPVNGVGDCGRLAPHVITSRIQKAILSHKIKTNCGISKPKK